MVGSSQIESALRQNVQRSPELFPSENHRTVSISSYTRESNDAKINVPRRYTPESSYISVWSETDTIVGSIRSHTTYKTDPIAAALHDNDDSDRRDWKTVIWFCPSSWLLKLGMSCVLHIVIARSVQQGWQSTFKVFNVRNQRDNIDRLAIDDD